MAKTERTDLDKRLSEKREGLVFSISEVYDVVQLLKNGEYPDSRFGDLEVSLWSMLRKELNMPVKM